MPVRSATLVSHLPSVAPGSAAQPKPSKPALHTPTMRPPLAIRVRRAWKRLAENRSRPALVLRHALRAFKMGIYFKVFVSLMLLARLANHGAQMYPPTESITRDEHFAKIEKEDATAIAHTGGVRAPSLRLIVISAHGDAPGLKSLLHSLAVAEYEGVHEPVSLASRLRSGRLSAARPKPRVSLDVWLFASSTANAIPLLFLPLAIALFGPPRYDHVVAQEALSFHWPHGPKHVVAYNREPDMTVTWTSTAASTNETVVFVDASRARHVAPKFSQWLRHAQMLRSDIAAYAFDSISFPNRGKHRVSGSNKDRDTSVATEAFFPATSMFSPTREAWITFLKWHELRMQRLWAAPTVPRAMRVGQYDRWEAMRADPVRAWFTQFAYEYQARIIHPWLPDGQVLVVRKAGVTDCASVAGAGVPFADLEESTRTSGSDLGSVHLSVDAEVRANAHNGPVGDFRSPSDELLVVKWDGSLEHLSSSLFGMPGGSTMLTSRESKRRKGVHAISVREEIRRVGLQDLISAGPASNVALQEYEKMLSMVIAHGRAHRDMREVASGGPTVALALISSDENVEILSSWLCNIATLRLVPPGLTLAVRDEGMAKRVQQLLVSYGSGSLGWRFRMRVIDPLVVTLPGDDVDLSFILLIRDVLDRGVSVMKVSIDQVWLSDPLPYVSTALAQQSLESGSNVGTVRDDGALADIVIARTSSGTVSPSFLYLRSSFAARFMWSEVVALLVGLTQNHGPAARIPPGEERMVLSSLVLNSNEAHAKRYPGVKWLAVNSDLFVDATWYRAFEGYPIGGVDSGANAKRPIRLDLTPYRREASRHPVLANLAVAERGELEPPASWKRRAQQAGHWFLRADGLCDSEAVQGAVGGRRTR